MLKAKNVFPFTFKEFYVESEEFFGIPIIGSENFLYSKEILSAYARYCSKLKYPPSTTVLSEGCIRIYWESLLPLRAKNEKILNQFYDTALNYAKTIECLNCYGNLNRWLKYSHVDAFVDEDGNEFYTAISPKIVCKKAMEYFEYGTYNLYIEAGRYSNGMQCQHFYSSHKDMIKWIKALKASS